MFFLGLFFVFGLLLVFLHFPVVFLHCPLIFLHFPFSISFPSFSISFPSFSISFSSCSISCLSFSNSFPLFFWVVEAAVLHFSLVFEVSIVFFLSCHRF